MTDFLDDYHSVLIDFIKTSLVNGEIEDLMGLQTLDSAIDFTGITGMESIINVMFTESVKAPQEAKEIRERLATDWNHYYELGVAEKLQSRAEDLENGFIPIGKVENACGGLRQYLPHIQKLQDYDIIRAVAHSGSVYTHLCLPKETWGKTIDTIVRTGHETQVFGSAMGKLLGIALSDRGFSSLKPLILAYNKANRTTGEISNDMFIEECCSAVSRPQRFHSNMIERDGKKADAIKAFKFIGDGKIILNTNGIRAISRWRTLAERRSRERTAGE